ncbi:MAG: HAMP domain-containing protein [Bacillota bacterium]|nr:HAMP domain-containing protein [Bacillota bacterium]
MIQRARTRFRLLFAPGSLRTQLLSRSLLILAVLLFLIGLLQYAFMQDVICRNKAASMLSQIMSVHPDAWRLLGAGWENGDRRPPFFFVPGANLAFVDADGNYAVLSSGPGDESPPRLDEQEYLEVLRKSPEPNGGTVDGAGGIKPPGADRPLRPDVLRKKPGPDYRIVDEGGAEQLVVLHPVFDHGRPLGVVQVSTLTGPLKELLVRQLLTFSFLSLVAMLFGLLGFMPVIRRTLVPLSNMVDTAEEIDAGNLARRFPTRQGQMEIDRLAESFNGMLERLEASFKGATLSP